MTHLIAWNNKIDVLVGDDFSDSRTNPEERDDDKNHGVHSTFNVAQLSPFDVGDDFSNSRTNPFEEGDDDKNHGVPTGPITEHKAKKIQQAFIPHLQNWIGQVQPSFHVLQADSVESRPFGDSKVNICTVEVVDEVASIIS